MSYSKLFMVQIYLIDFSKKKIGGLLLTLIDERPTVLGGPELNSVYTPCPAFSHRNRKVGRNFWFQLYRSLGGQLQVGQEFRLFYSESTDYLRKIAIARDANPIVWKYLETLYH